MFAVVKAYALPTNGDFSSNLASWTSTGPVIVQGGEAVLGDDAGGSSLLQPVGLAPGDYTIEFDFLNALAGLNPSADFFTFPDVFFASLYFSNTPAFDLLSLPLPGLALFDLDASGPYNAAGLITQSPKGGEWQHFSLIFSNVHPFAVPVFELFDLDFEQANSIVRLDNIVISGGAGEIPEPGTLLLLSAGAFALLRKKKSS